MLQLSDILGQFFESISFQRSEETDKGWVNTPIEMKDVKASILPKSEDDKTPPVYYNMWVNASASIDKIDAIHSELVTKGVTIASSSNSIFQKTDENKNTTSYRFLLVSSN
tara:strand:+ start:740 stop:1072 length:333 start_codon:yes stop_codon:yes gene_type:complete